MRPIVFAATALRMLQALAGVLLFAFAGHAYAAEGAVEVGGLLERGNGGALVVLSDKETKKNSAWLDVGDSWRGHKILRIDLANNTVRISKDGRDIDIPLRSSRVMESTQEGAKVYELIKGEAKPESGKVVYSAESVLGFSGWKIASRGGEMVADGAAITGNLLIEAPNGSTLPAAWFKVTDAARGKFIISASNPPKGQIPPGSH